MNTAKPLEVRESLVAGPSNAEPLRILLLDDDPAYSHLCQRYLSRDPLNTYEVVSVATAGDGVQACLDTEFDCLLVDYCLPDHTGTATLSYLQDRLGSNMPPSIVMSAMSGQEAAADAVRAGAVDFLQKGVVSSACLARSIRNAVEKGRLKQSVEQRRQQLMQANVELQARNEEIQRFYERVSHEVKTPLAAAREFIAIVLDGITGDITQGQQEMLEYARESCDQIAEHFNELVEMTQLEAGKVSLNRNWVGIDGLIKRCMASMKSAIEYKNIRCKRDIPEALPPVYVDGNRVIQVISNLVGNAIKYTPEGGEVGVCVSHDVDAAQLRIAVSDSGCGIEEKNLPKIFDRLYQVKPGSNTQVESGLGLGLGLSIAREIVELHEGKIWVDSEPGKGSTFSVSFPVGPVAAVH